MKWFSILALCFAAGCATTGKKMVAGENLRPGPYRSVDDVPVGPPAEFQPTQPERFRLANGTSVLLMRDSERPLIELTATYAAGSYDDPAARTGLAEITATVMRLGGSEAWPGDRLDDALAFRGAEIDFTSDNADSQGSVLCLSEDWNTVYPMFRDVLRSPTFPEQKLDLELASQRFEVSSRNDSPGPATSREAQRAFFGLDHPRARRVEMHDLDAMGRDDLVAFHRAQWAAGPALISVYGDFDPGSMRSLLERDFGSLAAPKAARADIPPPPPSRRRVVLASRDDVNQTEIRLALEGVRLDHPDYPALLISSYVFGAGGFSSFMVSRIRTDLGLAYSTGATFQQSLVEPGLFWAWCGTKNETCALAIREMFGVLDGYLAGGFTERQFEGARQRLLNSRYFRVDTRREILARLAELELAGYPADFDMQLERRLRELTRDEVLAACQRHLRSDQITLFVMGKPDEFDESLDQFGPVEAWDIDAVTLPASARP